MWTPGLILGHIEAEWPHTQPFRRHGQMDRTIWTDGEAEREWQILDEAGY